MSIFAYVVAGWLHRRRVPVSMTVPVVALLLAALATGALPGAAAPRGGSGVQAASCLQVASKARACTLVPGRPAETSTTSTS